MKIGAKIRKVRKLLGISQIEMAKSLDVNERSFGDYERDKKGVTTEFINNLIKVYNVNCIWLFKDMGEIFDDSSHVYIQNVDTDEENLAYIPKYDLAAAAGAGLAVDNEKVECMAAFNKLWLKNVVNASPMNLTAILAEGDSMEPTIKTGDFLLVDHSKNTPNDGIYVIRLDNSLIVKRIQCLPDSQIKAISDNKIYDPFIIDFKKQTDAAIIGKVVWFGRDMRG